MADTTLTNSLSGYSNIADGTNIQFKSGLQSALNAMINVGNAEEGTFYLTTDTHKLYVGRKSKTAYRTDSGHTSELKVIPEQVSRGVTVVGTSSELPTEFPADAPPGAIEEGELYYVTDRNILAALKYVPADPTTTPATPAHYAWIQINTPTGINTVATSAAAIDTGNVVVNTEIATAAGSKLGKTKFVAGDNVTLTSGNTTITVGSGANAINYTTGVVTIAAKDTTYEIGSVASASNGNVQIGLKKDGSPSLEDDPPVTISGSNTVGVTSDASGNITVKGPSFSNLSFAGKTGTSNGIEVTLNGTSGNANTALAISGTVDPQITYGKTGSKSTAHFKSASAGAAIIADLDIYTKTQTDTAINEAINEKIAAADAMSYKGIVTSASDLRAKVIANGGAHNGDTYKVGTVSSSFSVDGVPVSTGDLIILNGTEDGDSGSYPGQIEIGGAGVVWDSSSGSSGAYVVDNNDPDYSSGNILAICDLVPSGDEPQVTASASTTNTHGTTPNDAARVTLYDGKTGNDDTTNILTTRYVSGNMITVNATNPDASITGYTIKSSGEDVALTFSHNEVTRTDSSSEEVAAAGTANAIIRYSNAADTIGNNGYELFVFSNPSKALITDAYGHVTGLKGKTISFKHNKLNTVSTSYGQVPNTNTATFSLSMTDTLNNTKEATFKIGSNTLTVSGVTDSNTATNSHIQVDLKWGTF